MREGLGGEGCGRSDRLNRLKELNAAGAAAPELVEAQDVLNATLAELRGQLERMRSLSRARKELGRRFEAMTTKVGVTCRSASALSGIEIEGLRRDAGGRR